MGAAGSLLAYLNDFARQTRLQCLIVPSSFDGPSLSRIPFSAALSPDQLKQCAEIEAAQARRIEPGDERLRRLALADALTNLAEIKRLLLDYERRLLN